MQDLDNVSTFDKDTILRHLLHKLTQEQRRDLMNEYPAAYNRLAGREIMATTNLSRNGLTPSEVRDWIKS